MNSKSDQNCTEPGEGPDDPKTIADIYYNKKSDWIKSLLVRKEGSEIYEENGRLIHNIAIKMNDDTKNTIKSDNHAEFEDVMKVDDLINLKKHFYQTIKQKMNKLHVQEYVFDRNKRKYIECLNQEEFLDVLKCLPFYKDFENELEKLFHRIDHENLGYINWTDVTNYFTIRLRENEFSEFLKTKIFNIQPKIKLCEHNKREVTVRVLKIDSPLRFVNISRRGAVGIWSKHLNLIKSFQISPLSNFKTNNLLDRRTKNTMWIKDVVLLPELNKICIATTKRDLRFFQFSSENFNEEFSIYNLPTEPACLEYFYDAENGKGLLYFGDDSGKINILTFLCPTISLFDKTKNKLEESTLEIRWKLNREGRFFNHEEFISYSSIMVTNGNIIESIKFIPYNRTIVVSTASYNKSLVILDPELKKKEYFFSLYDGCSCFDIDMQMHILATAGNHSPIYIWDIYTPNKPISRLEVPGRRVISLKIHNTVGYLYSLTSNAVVEVWDLKDDHLVQTVELYFPNINLIQLEYEPFTMSLINNNSENNLIITCKDYIAHLVIGENLRISSSVPLSSNSPITCMAYSEQFKMIITCAEDSTIIFWNLLNGRKLFTIPNAHDKEEITVCELDKSERNFFTVSSNQIKVWNTVNGNLIQSFDTYNDSEITGLTLIDRKRLMIAVGTNKKIISYTDIKFDSVESTPPQLLYGGVNQHDDEILCSDLYENLLATGGREGEIKIWSIDTKRLFLLIRDKKENQDELRHAVDRILFIKPDQANSSLTSTLLVSSEGGYLYFWKISFRKEDRLLGFFYASDINDQLVFSLTTNSNNSILISGDTKGFIYFWDISKTKNSLKKFEKPTCLKSWRCHDSTIVSCKFIQSFMVDLDSDLLVTASSDWCCRVWTTKSDYIGSFGQEKKWKLSNEKTYISYDDFAILKASTENKINENTNNVEKVKLNQNINLSKLSGAKYDYLDSIKYFKSINKNKRSNLPKLIIDDKQKQSNNSESFHLNSDSLYSKLPLYDFDSVPNTESYFYSKTSSILL